MTIKQLAYIVFDIEEAVMPAMHDIFAKIFDTNTRVSEDGSVKVKLDGRDFRVLMRPAEACRLVAVGWEVEDAEHLSALSDRLIDSGIDIEQGNLEITQQRCVEELIRFRDSGGFPIELVIDGDYKDQQSDKDHFVCGEEDQGVFGLGHLVQVYGDQPKAMQFYLDVLGMHYSDQIDWKQMDADLRFLHCNQRHHSLAMLNEALGLKNGMIDHIMIEARTIEQVEQAYSRLTELGFSLSQTLGQHTNDQVTSFYMKTPAGFRLEFGYGGNTIGDMNAWQTEVYDRPSSWGHEPV